MKYFLRGMTKKTPKNPAHAVRAMSLPISFVGLSDRSWRRYIAGTAPTNKIPRPPEARMNVTSVKFSFPEMHIRVSEFETNRWPH
jgi:hypothetical protein